MQQSTEITSDWVRSIFWYNGKKTTTELLYELTDTVSNTSNAIQNSIEFFNLTEMAVAPT